MAKIIYVVLQTHYKPSGTVRSADSYYSVIDAQQRFMDSVKALMRGDLAPFYAGVNPKPGFRHILKPSEFVYEFYDNSSLQPQACVHLVQSGITTGKPTSTGTSPTAASSPPTSVSPSGPVGIPIAAGPAGVAAGASPANTVQLVIDGKVVSLDASILAGAISAAVNSSGDDDDD